MGRRRRFRLLASGLMTLSLYAGAVARPAIAASPTPPASEAPNDLGMQAWLDHEIRPDLAPGTAADVGLMLWDPTAGAAPHLEGLFIRLRPASGTAAPVEAAAVEDVRTPGHVVAHLTVPSGGPGAIEIGLHARRCDAGGTCADSDALLPIAGIGPPPDASPLDLFLALIRLPDTTLTAGEPADIEVDVIPRVDWDASAIPWPAQVILIAHREQSGDVANVTLARSAIIGEPYAGKLTVPEEGDLILEVAVPGDQGSADLVFPGSIQRLTVLPATAEASAGVDPGAGGSAGEAGPPIPLLVGGLLALVALGFVVRRAFADL